ncbi:MAG: tyrosine-protein phosphatase [Gemmatimonadales bacterium]
MIDIHSHLLPGVDDGSPSVAISVEVLARFAGEGVEMVVCTPHLRASKAAEAPHAAYAAIFETLMAAVPGPPALLRGWEIMLDVPGMDLTAPGLTLGTSSAVLVEFPRTGVPARAGDELFRLKMAGLVPVLAHPERYWGCTPELVRSWRQSGTVIQVDAVALLAGGRMGQLALAMLEEGLVDCLASDNHGDRRSLGAVRTWLGEQGAAEHATLLTEINPRRVLSNLGVLPVPPVRVGRGLLARLRELMRGRRG